MFHALRLSKKLTSGLAAALVLLLTSSLDAKAQISITASSLTYTQDFNTFNGTAASAASELPGWTLSPNTYKGTDCGTSTAGGIYAYGTAGDYSLGYLPTSSAPNDTFYAHVSFVNNTGGAISSVTISYNFERWRPNTRINGFVVVSDLGDVSALNQTGPGSTGTSCTVITTAKTVTLSGLNVPNGATFYVEFRGGRGTGTGGSQGVAIDDFELSATPLFAPTLTLGTLSDFGALCAGDTTAAQPLTVDGANLTDAVTVTAPAGFLLSSSAAGPFASTLTLTPTGGNLSETIYVAFAPTTGATYTDQITFTSAGLAATELSVSGTGNQVIPAVVITLDHDLNICEGTVVTFSADVTNGGVMPQINWLVNGLPTGITDTIFATSTLDSGDVITATVISSESCALDTAVSSNSIAVAVFPVVTPAISITATPSGVIEAGTTVTFNSTASGILSAPEYTWLLNGDSVANGPAYVTDSLSDGDVVQAILYTDSPCATNDSALSNSLTIQVNTSVSGVPAVSFTIAPNPTSGTFYLKGPMNGAGKTAQLKLTNPLGQLIYQVSVPVMNGAINTQITLETLPAGLYILSIESGAVRQHQRLEIYK